MKRFMNSFIVVYIYICGPVMIQHQHKRSCAADNNTCNNSILWDMQLLEDVYDYDARVTLAWGASCCFPQTHLVKRFFSFFSSSSRLFPPSFLLIDVFLYMSSALQINRSPSSTYTHVRAHSDQTRVCKYVTWQFWLCSWIIHMNIFYSYKSFVLLSWWGL